MPFSLPINPLSFLPGFMYVISARSKKVRSHYFSSSDKTIRFLPRVSASFTRIWYCLTNPRITSVFLRGLTGNAFSTCLMSPDNTCFVEKDYGVLLAGFAVSLGVARLQHCFWRVQGFFFWRYNLNCSLASFFLNSYFSGCFTWNRVKVLHTSTKSLFSHCSTIKPLFKSIKFDWEYDLEILN